MHGETAEKNEWRWMASLRAKPTARRRGSRHFCGGSVITARHVLTAAHCIVRRKGRLMKPDAFLVYTGSHTLIDGIPHGVSSIAVHGGHKLLPGHTRIFDFAILCLKWEIRFGPKVGPVCLPFSDGHRNAAAGEIGAISATVTGWGWFDAGNVASGALNELEDYRIVECDDDGGSVHRSRMCAIHANGPNHRTAKGDSGGWCHMA